MRDETKNGCVGDYHHADPMGNELNKICSNPIPKDNKMVLNEGSYYYWFDMGGKVIITPTCGPGLSCAISKHIPYMSHIISTFILPVLES